MSHRKGFHQKALVREAFAERVTAKRIALGLSMSELARKADLTKYDVSNYEGALSIAGNDNMLKLADALETTPDHLRGKSDG